jgi:long-subunit fatty acid transport protein
MFLLSITNFLIEPVCGTPSRWRVELFGPVLATALLLAGLPNAAMAQLSYNTNIMPLGDAEALLGNTGTGGLSSTGAVFYNPAALIMLEGSSFSLTGSAYMQYTFEAKPVSVIDGNELDYEGIGFQSVPTSLVMVRSLGAWKVAFSLLVPTQFKYEGQENWSLTVGGIPYRLKLLQNYREVIFMGGLSAARKINDRWSWGVSVYGQYFYYLSSSDVRFSNSNEPARISISSERDQRAPVSLYVLAGLHRQGEKLGLGLRIAAPSFRISGAGAYYNYIYVALSDLSPPVVSETDLTGLKADFETPLDLRLGVTYTASDKLRLALDASYGAGVEYESLSGQGYSLSEELESTYRLSTGGEYSLAKGRALLGGLSWTPTTSTVESVTNTIDFVSYTAGVKVTMGRSETTLGYFGALGTGALPYADGNGSLGQQTYQFNGAFLATALKLY